MNKTSTPKRDFIAGLIAIVLVIMIVAPMLLNTTSFAAPKKAPGYVSLTKISAPAYNKVKINWKKTSNATHYKIYYRKSGTKKWIGVKTLSSKSSSYTHKSNSKRPIIVGQKYDYTVKGYNKKYKTYGKYNTNGMSINTKPNTLKLTDVVLNGNNVNVSWNKTNGCDMYKIYRKAESSKWNLIDTVSASITSYIDKTPVKGKRNVYTVKSYYSKTKTYGNYDKTGIGVYVSNTEKPQKPSEPIKVEQISISPQSLTLSVGETATLSALVFPSNATNKNVEWESADPDIIKVEQFGNKAKVTALKYGTGEVCVNAKDSGYCLDTIYVDVPMDEEQAPEIMAQEVLELTNKVRAKYSQPPLKLHPKLQEASHHRAKELSIKYDHRRPNGTLGPSIAIEYGLHHISAENIAMGFHTPKQVVDAWEQSPGHQNAMISNSKFLGVGYYKDIKTGISYWVQFFIGTENVEAPSVTITFDAQGGIGGTIITLPYGAPVYLEDINHPIEGFCKKSEFVPNVTKPGYKLVGWKDEHGTYLKLTAALNNTVYAIWEKN